MERLTLYEKYKLVEKTELEVNGIWKGAHLLLFFLAFVFGSFCTFCFHMLMYLFDEKCVLFPKLMSLSSIRQNIIYEFIPEDKESADMLPVDFLSTQWVEKSVCLLPTYVPLVSGIFGLVWTTMFLMCSIGSRVLTGLQRPWRVLPPVFLFSIVMGGICVYTSTVTHCGLQELCLKLSEITGSTSCSYTVNVATLAYQRRIRGVYQATRLTIFSAWLHTICWLLSALLALARILLVVDFKLVRVTVQLHGDIDKMLERHEKEIRTISPDFSPISIHRSRSNIRIHFMKKQLQSKLVDRNKNGDLLYFSDLTQDKSELSLVPTERQKLDKLVACSSVLKEHQFIVKMLYNLLDTVYGTQTIEPITSSSSSELSGETTPPIVRQYGQQQISSTLSLRRVDEPIEFTSEDLRKAEIIASEIKRQLQSRLNKKLSELKVIKKIAFESSINISSEMELAEDRNKSDNEQGLSDDTRPSTSKEKKLKPSLKHTAVQTETEKLKDKSHKVQIDSKTKVFDPESSKDGVVLKENKDTQTKKEKQD